MKRTHRLAVAVAALLAAGAAVTSWGLRQHSAVQFSERPARWAQPMQLPGLTNFYKVNNRLYRGAQSDAEGMCQLTALGVRTVVNLRSGDIDSAYLADTGLDYEHIRFHPWHAEDEDVLNFLRIATDPNRTPVFVHCQHGSDRTGVMCAVYRMVVDGWSKDEAVREMLEGGYGFHNGWQNLVLYLRQLDVDALRARLVAGPLSSDDH